MAIEIDHVMPVTRRPPVVMVGGDGYIYLTVQNNGSYAANTMQTKVYQLDPENSGLLQMGQTFPIAPEAAKLAAVRTLCIYGQDERDSLCPQLAPGHVQAVP